jgi:hypothetical protein
MPHPLGHASPPALKFPSAYSQVRAKVVPCPTPFVLSVHLYLNFFLLPTRSGLKSCRAPPSWSCQSTFTQISFCFQPDQLKSVSTPSPWSCQSPSTLNFLLLSVRSAKVMRAPTPLDNPVPHHLNFLLLSARSGLKSLRAPLHPIGRASPPLLKFSSASSQVRLKSFRVPPGWSCQSTCT